MICIDPSRTGALLANKSINWEVHFDTNTACRGFVSPAISATHTTVDQATCLIHCNVAFSMLERWLFWLSIKTHRLPTSLVHSSLHRSHRLHSRFFPLPPSLMYISIYTLDRATWMYAACHVHNLFNCVSPPHLPPSQNPVALTGITSAFHGSWQKQIRLTIISAPWLVVSWIVIFPKESLKDNFGFWLYGFPTFGAGPTCERGQVVLRR